MRGLPSREWRTTTNNYGATQQVSSSWKDRIIPLLIWALGQIQKYFQFVGRLWKSAWVWSTTKPPKRWQRIGASFTLLAITAFFISIFIMRSYNWITREDACIVAERAKVAVLEEEETNGVFTELPKIVHWEQEEDTSTSDWSAEMKRLFPSTIYIQMQWTRQKIRTLIAEKYPWYLSTYDANMDEQLQHISYFILNEHGGLYVSAQYQIFSNFWDSLPKDRPGLVESPFKYKEEVSPWLMSSPPGHPFWNITLAILAENLAQSSSSSWFGGGRTILSTTELLNKAVNEARRPTALGDGAVYELPCENFFRVPAQSSSSSPGRVTSTFRNFKRSVLLQTVFVKPCGNVEDSRCQYGVYHEQ